MIQTQNGNIENSLLNFYNKANKKGYFNFANRNSINGNNKGYVLDGGYALQNFNIGLGTALTRINNEHIEMITQSLKAEYIVGERTRELDFEEDNLLTAEIKFAGETSSYSDTTNPNTLSLNVNMVETGHLRDSINIRLGDLQSNKLTKANINAMDKMISGAIKTLMQRWNDVCFKGNSDNNADTTNVYGILNYPHLSEFITLKTDLANVEYKTLHQDIKTLISELQSQNNHIDDTTEMRLCVTQGIYNALKVEGNMQKTLMSVLKETYPNLTIVSNVNEFRGAYNDKSVIYILAETPDDGSLVKRTAKAPYSELGLFSRVDERENYISQNISIGHCGVVFNKPYNVVRGVVASGNA